MDIIVQILLSFNQKPMKHLCVISTRSKRTSADREKLSTLGKRPGLHPAFQGTAQVYMENNF